VITLPPALLTHYNSRRATLGYLLRITRTDGVVFGFTSATDSVTIGGVFYDAENGLDPGTLASSAGLAVDNMELSTINDGTIFTRAQILGGVWQNAAYIIYRYNWAPPSDGLEPLTAGTIGQVRLRDGMITAELRGLQQYLQQSVGNATTRTCRARFADYPTPNGSNLCRLNPATYTDTLTVSAVVDDRTFETSAGPVKPDDWYGEGAIKWTAGGNVNIVMRAKAYVAASKRFTLVFAPSSPIIVGNTLTAIAGCRKRLTEDCKTKFLNVLNFQGEPHLPGIDRLTAAADVSV